MTPHAFHTICGLEKDTICHWRPASHVKLFQVNAMAGKGDVGRVSPGVRCWERLPHTKNLTGLGAPFFFVEVRKCKFFPPLLFVEAHLPFKNTGDRGSQSREK
ncbi:UNVERIFIED_CONTAM: hypothetical protein K2H54_075116 [Gekko kuhli]